EQFALAAGAPNTPRDYRVSFSANESRAAVVGQVRGKAVNTVECVAHVWDVEAGVLVATRPVTWTDMNYDTNTHCALSPDGERLVVAGFSRAGNLQQVTAGALEVATGKQLGRYNCPSNYMTFPPAVALDNRSVLLPGPDGHAVVWDMVTGAVKQSFGPEKRIANIPPRIAPSGRFAALVAYEQRMESTPQVSRTLVRYSLLVVEWASGEVPV